MREYQPTDVNRRNLKAIPTPAELKLHRELQLAIRDACLKVLDKHTDAIQRSTFNLVASTDGETYFPSLFDISLVKQEGDSYYPSIDVNIQLRIPSTENPNYNPDEEMIY